MLQCNLGEHPIVDIWEDLDTLKFLKHGEYLPKLQQVIGIVYNHDLNATHGRTITLFDAYRKVIEWFLHHMNDMVLFTRSLDTLELNVLIVFLLLIIVREVCMLKSETSLLGVNNVIE
jgi:hypothetical protein